MSNLHMKSATSRPEFKPLICLTEATNEMVRMTHEKACTFCEEDLGGDYSYLERYIIVNLAFMIDSQNRYK